MRLAVGAGGLALLSSLAACTPRPAKPVSSGPIDLSFWTHDDAYEEFFRNAVPLAEQASEFRYNFDVTRAGSNDIITKLIAQAVAGKGTPDLVGLEVGAFTRTMRGNIAPDLLADLSELVAPFGDDYLQARRTTFSKNGVLYALDSDNPMTVFYRRDDEFRRLGLPEVFETWDDYLAAGKKIAASEGISLGMVSTGDPRQTTQAFHLHLLQRGGDLFDENGELNIMTPEAEEVMTLLADAVQSGVITTVPDMYGSGAQSGVKSGKVIAVNMPSWYAAYGIQPSAPEQSGMWRIGPLPRFAGGGGRTGAGGGTGFAVLKDKPATAAAMQLLSSAYLDPAQQVARFKAMGYLPTLRSVYDDPELISLEDEFFGGQQTFQVYREIVDESPEINQSEFQTIIDSVLAGHLLRAYRGDVSPAQALKDATDDFRGQARG